MTLWGRLRDGVLAAQRQLGRRVALSIVGALQKAHARGERVHILGGVRQVFERLGVQRPDGKPWSDKAARAALHLLASFGGGRVVRLTGHTWRVVSELVDAFDPRQLDLFDEGTNGKGESAPGNAAPTSTRPTPGDRTRARTDHLERVAGREPRHPEARSLARAVDVLGALAEGKALSITLTQGGRPVDEVAADWVEGLEVVLVPERSHVGRLHYHGIVLADPTEIEALRDKWHRLGGGHIDIKPIREMARLRYWAAYSFKGQDHDLDVLARGLLGVKAAEESPTVESPADPQSAEGPRGLRVRAREWLERAWRKWGTR